MCFPYSISHNINHQEHTTIMMATTTNNKNMTNIDIINDRITKLRKMSLNSSPFQEEQRRSSFGSVVSTSGSSSCMKMSSSHSSSSIMSLSSSSNKNNKPRRSVHFSETSSVVVLPCRSTSDFERCWYSRSDLATFKQNVKNSSQSLRRTRTAKLMKYVAYLAAQTTTATTAGGGNSSSSSSSSSSEQDQPSSSSSSSSCSSQAAAAQQAPLLENMASKSKAAIRGMEHLLCPMVCKLLLKRRRLVMDAVLREQLKLNQQEASSSSSSGDYCFIDEDERVRRIALVAHRQSKFSKEWTRRITSLQQ